MAWGYGENIKVDQKSTNIHTCPAQENGQACGATIELPADYCPGDPQVTVECSNPNGLKPHKFIIFTTQNTEIKELDGQIQTFASTEIHD
ncbi:MAG: hypothetical protein WCP93_03890 [Candidatus Berkelbacteria bacterium]